MIKRIVIAGCRYYDNYGEAKQFIDKWQSFAISPYAFGTETAKAQNL